MIEIAGKNVRKLIHGAVEKLESALRRGKSETLKAYLRAMGRFSTYSLGNALLIASQRPDSTRVAGFHAWRRLGRWVRKGERGIAILAPMVRRQGRRWDLSADEGDGDDATTTGIVRKRPVTGFKTAHVFDISQTDGRPLPEFSQVAGNPGQHLDQLKRFAAERNIQVEYTDFMGGADGASRGGVVRIRRGLSAAAEFSTLAHEVGHELLHYDKQERPRIVRETEAEAVAFVVCESAGIESRVASADYLQLWDGRAEIFLASLNRVREAALAIIGGLDVGEEGGGGGSLSAGRTAT